MQERKFKSLVGDLKDSKIGLFLSGNQFIEAVLLDVKQDHLIVNVDQKVMYVALQHIKALSKNAKDICIVPKKVPYLNRNTLVDVWRALRYNWVCINSLGNQEVFGVLTRISEDYLTLINNAELLYIPNAHISNMYSQITKEQIILLNQTEQITSPKTYLSTIHNEIAEMNKQHEDASEKGSEASIVENDAGELVDDVEHPVVSPKIEISREPEVLNSDEENNSNAERHTDSPQEKVIRGFAPQITDEAQQQSKVLQEEEPITAQQLEQTSSNEVKENSKLLAIENFASLVMSVANSKHESPGVNTTDVLLLEKQDEMDHEEAHLFEENYQDEYEASSYEKPFSLVEYQSRLNERRILLTEWNTIMDDHRTMLSQNNSETNDQREMPNQSKVEAESEFPVDNEITFKKKRRKKRLKRSNHSILKTNSTNEVENDVEVLDEKHAFAEITSDPITNRQLSPEEQARLKMQYYALMMHAAGNAHGTEPNENNLSHLSTKQTSSKEMAVKQYQSLMKHAEQMYQQLRDLR